MSVYVNVTFNPTRLTAAVLESLPVSLKLAEADARAHVPSERMADVESGMSSPLSGWLRPTGLGHVFEKGRKGGYLIEPKRSTALKFRGGEYYAEATGGAMAPRPYVGPAAAKWASGGYQAAARATLRMRGFA